MASSTPPAASLPVPVPAPPVSPGDKACGSCCANLSPQHHSASSLTRQLLAAAAPKFPAAFLKKLPKTDLHVHLDGSVRVQTVIELARELGVELPAYDEPELRRLVFKDQYHSLEEYLECFKYTTAVMQTPAALERIAYEFAVDAFDDGVRYFEVRFAPQLHAHDTMTLEDVLVAVNSGLRRARDEYNAHPAVAAGTEPEYEYAIIVCAMRFFTAHFSRYYATFCRVHEHEPPERLYGLASMALAAAALAARDAHSLPITALDIAGAEKGFPAETHVEAFKFVHKRFLNKTVHAGEGYGPASIFQAITDLHAERIGHGFHLFSDGNKLYTDALAEYLAAQRVTLEVCLSSNLQTVPELAGDLAHHPFARMLAQRHSVTLCTDNRTVSATTVSRELSLATEAFHLTPKQLKDLVICGFKRSFFPRCYTQKRAYSRKIMNYYDALEREFGIADKP